MKIQAKRCSLFTHSITTHTCFKRLTNILLAVIRTLFPKLGLFIDSFKKKYKAPQ